MLTSLLALVGSASCPGLPLTPGTTWTYRAEVAWAVGTGDSTGRQCLAWTTTVVSVQASDSAVAATVQGWPSDLAWWTPGHSPSTSVLYCVGGRVYLLRSQLGTAAELVEAVLNGQHRPTADDLILRLPLHTGDLFGRDSAERHDTFYAWVVEGAGPVPVSVRRVRPGVTDSLYSVVYRATPDYTLIGFVPGLGVAHYMYSHHGTTAETDAWLVAYRPGPR